MPARIDPGTAALLLLPPLLWAGNAIVGRALVGEFPPLALSLWRWTLALALIAPFTALALWRERGVIRQWWGPLLAISAVGVGVGQYHSRQYLALPTAKRAVGDADCRLGADHHPDRRRLLFRRPHRSPPMARRHHFRL
ncbi:MAG: DMT family transporter, partial [Burkholderiaceae bacterium]